LSNLNRAILLAILALACTSRAALGQQAPATDAAAPAPAPAPAPANAPASSPAPGAPGAPSAPATKEDTLEAIVVNGIRRGDLIMPTTVTSTSAFGLDLGVMETPRNNTVLSTAQLEALNIQNPQGFSFLTSSSYSDGSFGVPNVPRIRGQYADVFFNGMRDSFTLNGYGAPISFNGVDQMDIVKGPASVMAGPGAGVGGAIDMTTKLPNPSKFVGTVYAQVDTLEKRRLNLDYGGPTSDNFRYRLSYTGDYSGSYYAGMYFHQESLYGVAVANITPKYTVQFNTEYVDARLKEDDGINRVNQQLIDNGSYLTGSVPSSQIESFLTPVTMGNPTQISREANIDEAPGTHARALRYNAQIIQTYEAGDGLTIVNNTFYNFMDRFNIIPDYYADTCKACYTIENKTDVKFKVSTPFAGLLMNQSLDAGFTVRYAHVASIQNFAAETISVFDLTSSPSTWVVPQALQPGAGAYLYNAAFGAPEWGVPARNSIFANSTINSNLSDAALFLEDRVELTQRLAVMYGLRMDAVHLVESDPLGGAGYFNGLPEEETTPWYTLANANISPQFKFTPSWTGYLTYNFAQYVDPTANDGGVGTFGVDPTTNLRQDTRLTELGSKFDLLDKSLFVSTALYEQERSIPVGPSSAERSFAHIKGLELEANYQPGPRFFGTASYSFMRTVLDTPAGFYNFPAQNGLNYDGAGIGSLFSTATSFMPGQTFNDPGVPRHLFNILANYKDPSGIGAQANLQVIGPIETTQSGQLNLLSMYNSAQGYPFYPGNAAASCLNSATAVTQNVKNCLAGYVPASVLANGGYYQSPKIPWQYTINSAVFYDYKNYEFKFSIFNVTNRRNLTNDIPFYGNDFISVNPPRSYGLSVKAKFG